MILPSIITEHFMLCTSHFLLIGHNHLNGSLVKKMTDVNSASLIWFDSNQDLDVVDIVDYVKNLLISIKRRYRCSELLTV